MEPVDVLVGVDGADHGARIDVLRQWQLNEDAVDGGIGVEVGDQRTQLGFGDVGGQRVLDRMEAAFLRHLRLRGDIDLACRILADDDDGEARLHARAREIGHAGLYRRDNLVRQLPSVDALSHVVPPVPAVSEAALCR